MAHADATPEAQRHRVGHLGSGYKSHVVPLLKLKVAGERGEPQWREARRAGQEPDREVKTSREEARTRGARGLTSSARRS